MARFIVNPLMANANQSSNADVPDRAGSHSARVVAFSTLGHGSNEEARIRDLLRDVELRAVPIRPCP